MVLHIVSVGAAVWANAQPPTQTEVALFPSSNFLSCQQKSTFALGETSAALLYLVSILHFQFLKPCHMV